MLASNDNFINSKAMLKAKVREMVDGYKQSQQQYTYECNALGSEIGLIERDRIKVSRLNRGHP